MGLRRVEPASNAFRWPPKPELILDPVRVDIQRGMTVALLCFQGSYASLDSNGGGCKVAEMVDSSSLLAARATFSRAWCGCPIKANHT